MRGRKPKPTKLKILQGVDRSDRRNDCEPEPDRAMPKVPKHLDKEARAEWRRIAPELYDLGLLTQIDRAALAAYCQAWARWVAAERSLQTAGDVTSASLYLPVANRALREMHSFLSEFGMTPASRTRIKVAPAGGADPLAEFLQSEAK